jgi:hypothetical protein
MQDHALENLRYIRRAMERAGSFTAVSGRGGILMGFIALAAGLVADRQPYPNRWLAVWVAGAAIALPLGFLCMYRKAARGGVSLLSGPGRRFALSFGPSIAAGLMLTLACKRAGLYQWMPALWLLLYGSAVASGGAHSVGVVPLMGATIMALGAVALFGPAELGNPLLMAGFGAAQIGFGLWIARRHGG